MNYGDNLALATRHVAEGEGIVARQRALIARLAGKGISTIQAEILLESFLGVLAEMRRHLRAIRIKLGLEPT